MANFASISGVQSGNAVISAIVLCVACLVVYPGYVALIRMQASRRIRAQKIMSLYTLPLDLAPAELAYIFSARITKRHIMATLFDLANRGILVLHEKEGATMLSVGPKMVPELKSFEKMLVGQVLIAAKNEATNVQLSRITEGYTNYVLSNGEKVQGSREYVFWWLVRDSLRTAQLIESRSWPIYIRALAKLHVLGALALSIIPAVVFRFFQMSFQGGLELSVLSDTFIDGIVFWVLSSIVVLPTLFFLLRFQGLMLGRRWIMRKRLLHYRGQLEAYRSFVRLTHKSKLHFVSDQLKKESLASTRPYAVALGYVKR